MRAGLLVSALFLVSLPADEPSFAQYDTGMVNSSTKALFSYADLRKLIEEKKVRGIDELLPHLPEEYRRYYTLLYKSASLQHASPSHPRVILYGRDAKPLLSYAGHPGKAGADRLELIEWDEKTSSFRMREIEFPVRGKGGPVFHDNPTSCVQCHRDPPRPNWDTYNSWRGAFGSISRNGIYD